jgi:4-hydroxybenzoyl-CoA thioesterase
MTPFVFDRPVRFEEVDAAGIVFFPRFLEYCHEAMEALLAPLEGGYAHLVMERKLGLPAVRVEADFSSPLRFGDVARIRVTVEQIGRTSCTLLYEMASAKTSKPVARVRHVVVLSDLRALQKVEIPADVRAILERHVPADAPSSSQL